MMVLGLLKRIGWKANSLAMASKSATLVNSDGCRLKPPGRAIQRSTELALKMMIYRSGNRDTI